MTDARSALERLTLWREATAEANGEAFLPVRSIRVSELRALLSTVEQMREALKNLNDIRNGEGGTLRVDPETGWPLAWGECPADPTEDKP